MTVIAACPHGMPSPRACFSCMEDGPVADPAKKWWRQGLPFLAQYPGTCVACHGGYPVAARVQRWDFGSSTVTERTGYTHAVCEP